MRALTFLEARAIVVGAVRPATPAGICPVDECAGRVLAEDMGADRDYPPFHRATRDGFAVRSGDIPGRLRIVGEARAGRQFDGQVNPGEAVEIMDWRSRPGGRERCCHGGTLHPG